MSPSEIEEMLDHQPFQPIRLTLASGDQVLIRRREQAQPSGLALILKDDLPASRFGVGYRLVSFPNIVLAEVLDRPPSSRERRPRKPR